LLLMLFICFFGIAPWTARNLVVFGRLVPVRSNFWPELYFNNVDYSLYPAGPSMLYQTEGENLYVRDLQRRFLDSLHSDPGDFARKSWRRVPEFWTAPNRLFQSILLITALGGIVQARRRGRRWLGFASVLLFYPLVFYATSAFARYRYPIEPVMFALGAAFLCDLCRAVPLRVFRAQFLSLP